jgi:methyl-galactoside transport system substrate-binding protein
MIKRILAFFECIVIMFFIISEYSIRRVNAQTNELRQKPVIIDVVLFNYEDKYISLVKQSLEDIQKQNEGKVKLNFYDSKGNQAIQDEILANLSRHNQDILLVNLVDITTAPKVIERFSQKRMPIIFFNREPVSLAPLYGKAYYVGTNAGESGELQGKIIINLWNNNREAIDLNGDGVLEYTILRGQQTNKGAQEITKSVISTIEGAGIKTKQLEPIVANWDRKLAREDISTLFLKYGTEVEAILANNDEMAIGAVEALQNYGYNLGDKKKTIVVVGIDATPEAQELIKKGFMAGSVFQDPSEIAKAIYTIGMNLFEGKEPLSGTPYKFDDTGIAVRLPYGGKYIG